MGRRLLVSIDKHFPEHFMPFYPEFKEISGIFILSCNNSSISHIILLLLHQI